jgi:hypothetical protein
MDPGQAPFDIPVEAIRLVMTDPPLEEIPWILSQGRGIADGDAHGTHR